MSKTKVLFLCTGNTARSQMAEAFLRAHAGDHFDVHSAGLKPREIDPLTIRVMAERGFDLAGQRAKGLDEYLGKVHFGYLVTVSAGSGGVPRVSLRARTPVLAVRGPGEGRRW